MNNLTKSLLTALFLSSCLYNSALAADYVILDFETPATGLDPVSKKGYPEWTLNPVFDSYFGPGNNFQITDTTSHSGNYSLRFLYEGRNGTCNHCGAKTINQIDDEIDGLDYFVAKTGEDLTQEYYSEKQIDPNDSGKGTFTPHGPHASPGKIVYNESRGFAQWKVVSVQNANAVNDKLTLTPVRKGIGSFASEEPVINAGDKIKITRQCGVDGIIGVVGGLPDLTRRSDCDGVITWFNNIAPDVQACGTSIFRRVYLKHEVVGFPSGHKINYARLFRGAGPDRTLEVVAVASTEPDNIIEPHVTGFAKVGGLARYQPGTGDPDNIPDGLEFKRGKWYYFEQEYQAASCTINTHLDTDSGIVIVDSYTGNEDGAYRLWFAESGDDVAAATPILEIKDIKLPPLLGGNGTHMSFWGNEGHHVHTRGSWYIDDMVISTIKIGPIVSPGGTNTATPKSPTAAAAN